MHALMQNEGFWCHFTRDKNELVYTIRMQSLFTSLCTALIPRRKISFYCTLSTVAGHQERGGIVLC